MRLTGGPLGFAFAAANAVLFALYITLGHRIANGEGAAGIDGLALAMLVAAVVALPVGVGVGVCSSVIPYVCDQQAMSRVPRATYALMVALLPATATVIGVLVLAQVPTAPEVAGVALVVAGVAAAVRRPARHGR